MHLWRSSKAGLISQLPTHHTVAFIVSPHIIHSFELFYSEELNLYFAQGPHSHILMTGGPKDFFESDILAKRDFFGSMKDAGICLGRENNTGIFFGYCIFHQLKSTITSAQFVVLFLTKTKVEVGMF